MKLLENKIVISVIVLLISIIVYNALIKILERSEKKNRFNLQNGKKRKTYWKLIKNLIRYLFIIVTFFLILQVNGVNISSIIAGVGIFGVIFGFAIQDWLKDIFRGSSIISDNYFSVEDIVKYKEIEGKVLEIGLKTTKIEDLRTGNIISIANRNIEEIQVVSNLLYISIPMPYELPIENAEKIIENITSKIDENEKVMHCKYKGVNELADSSINYLIEISCDVINKLQIRRDALKTILLELENNNISVPYNQIDIHQK